MRLAELHSEEQLFLFSARWKLTVGIAALVAASGCGGSGQGFGPSVEMKSAHFAYYAEDGTTYPPKILALLEAQRADFATLLSLPEGITVYHLVKDEKEASNHCGHFEGQPDCALGNELVSTNPLHFHELVHAYTYARFGHFPSPLLAEGVATLVDCLGDDLAAAPSEDADWRVATALSPDGHWEPYVAGRRFVKYLVDSVGWEKFWRYYDSDTYSLNPDDFARNYESFFGESLDAAWALMRQNVPPLSSTFCPCSSPPPSFDGTLRNLSAFSATGSANPFLYDTVPSTEGKTLRIDLPQGYGGQVAACSGGDKVALGFPNADVTLFRTQSSSYISAGFYQAELSNWLADSCEGADSIDVSGLDGLTVYDSRAAGAVTPVFLNLRSDGVRSSDISYISGRACDTCAMNDSACIDLPGHIQWSGTKSLRLDLRGKSALNLAFSTVP